TITATNLSTPGIYSITVSGAVDADYDITQINGTLTVRGSRNSDSCGIGSGISAMIGFLILALWSAFVRRR
ncbi:MAG TPA: MBG domain-containing protein, partial [Planctomycetota bacterium]|nr:MBG domain-containing protein [Planctomycetota bacterium]